jgi:hypothetical protein
MLSFAGFKKKKKMHDGGRPDEPYCFSGLCPDLLRYWLYKVSVSIFSVFIKFSVMDSSQ